MGLSSDQVSGESLLLDWPSKGGDLEIPKPEKLQPLKCPRCDSANTKFCYYNNYSRLQPRHYCRACRRHWTEGGTLRNVPVGGGRKTKRSRTSRATSKRQEQVGTVPFCTDIFPDIFGGVLFRPPPQPLNASDYSFGLVSSLMPPPPPPVMLGEFGGSELLEDINPFSMISTSSSSSSPYSYSRGEDLVTMTDGSAWLRDQAPELPASYWNCCEGMTDFTTPELGYSAPDRSRCQ